MFSYYKKVQKFKYLKTLQRFFIILSKTSPHSMLLQCWTLTIYYHAVKMNFRQEQKWHDKLKQPKMAQKIHCMLKKWHRLHWKHWKRKTIWCNSKKDQFDLLFSLHSNSCEPESFVTITFFQTLATFNSIGGGEKCPDKKKEPGLYEKVEPCDNEKCESKQHSKQTKGRSFLIGPPYFQ